MERYSRNEGPADPYTLRYGSRSGGTLIKDLPLLHNQEKRIMHDLEIDDSSPKSRRF
jgi:hypothetical protein